MHPVVVAINNLADAEVKWESVSERLIEEWRRLKKTVSSEQSSAAVWNKCDFWNRPGHTTPNCWINPENPNKRLKVLKKGVQAGQDDSDSDQEIPAVSCKDKKKKKEGGVVLRILQEKTTKRPDFMVVDSGTTSHMTAKSDRVIEQETCIMKIHLADDSTVSATNMGVRMVK